LDKAGRQDEAIAAIEEILVDNERLTTGPIGTALEKLKAGESLPGLSQIRPLVSFSEIGPLMARNYTCVSPTGLTQVIKLPA